MTKIYDIANVIELKNDILAFLPVARNYSGPYAMHTMLIAEALNTILLYARDAEEGIKNETLDSQIEALLFLSHAENAEARAITRNMSKHGMGDVLYAFCDMIDHKLRTAIVIS